MSEPQANQDFIDVTSKEYEYGFVTDIESKSLPPGLDEGTIKKISKIKNEPAFMLEWRLDAFKKWKKMQEPTWARVTYPSIDYQDIVYYSAPKSMEDRPQSLDEVDPELLAMYEKLGIPMRERAALAGVAVDVVFDSVSVATTFKKQLAQAGVIFCSFSEAVQEHPELVQKYLGLVVPKTDNFFRRSIQLYFQMVHLFTFLKGCDARWSFQPISELTK